MTQILKRDNKKTKNKNSNFKNKNSRYYCRLPTQVEFTYKYGRHQSIKRQRNDSINESFCTLASQPLFPYTIQLSRPTLTIAALFTI